MLWCFVVGFCGHPQTGVELCLGSLVRIGIVSYGKPILVHLRQGATRETRGASKTVVLCKIVHPPQPGVMIFIPGHSFGVWLDNRVVSQIVDF